MATLRTFDDWSDLLATDPAAAAARIEEAIHLAGRVHELRRIVHSKVGDPTSRLRLAERLVEMTLQRPEVWGFRDAATLFAALGRTDRAHEVLEGALTPLRACPAHNIALLAGGWVDLGATGRAIEVLKEEHTRRPFDVESSCSLGKTLFELGDAEGRRWVEAAEAEVTPQQAWRVATAWSALGERERAENVLRRALADATTLPEVLRLVSAGGCYGLEWGALALAMSLARTSAEWLEVAGASAEDGTPAEVRFALQQAIVDATAAERTEIARGYRTWLEDPEAAAATAPAGVLPSQLEVGPWPENCDPDPLYASLRASMNPARIEVVAEADYGSGFETNRAALEDLVRTGLVTPSLPWYPREVLELTRWTRGPDVDHVARAFCAAVLLFQEERDLAYDLPILLDSCWTLGGGYREDLWPFLGWLAAIGDEGPAYPDPLPGLARALHALRWHEQPHDLGRFLETLPPTTLAEALEYSSLRRDLWRSLAEQALAAQPHAALQAWLIPTFPDLEPRA